MWVPQEECLLSECRYILISPTLNPLNFSKKRMQYKRLLFILNFSSRQVQFVVLLFFFFKESQSAMQC